MRHRLLLTLLFLTVAMMIAAQEVAPKYPPANLQKYNQYIDAARKGDMEAQMEIAKCLDSRDVDCGIYWVRKAAEQGHQTALIYMIALYSGAAQEYQSYASKENLKQIIEIGYANAEAGKYNVSGLTWLGLLYYTNADVRDDKKALQLFQKSAAHPHPDDMTLLAVRNRY